MWRRPRFVLWAAAGVATAGFLIALEVAARRYGQPGPLTVEAQELVFAPHSGPLLYAGLALAMVVLTWRQRMFAAAAAVGIDVVFFLVRLVVGADLNFGNGALWVILGLAVLAVARRTGNDRALLLKGCGLGMLLVFGHKTGDTWLLITAKEHPQVLDPYVALADHALGNPSWVAGRALEAIGPFGSHLLNVVYGQLPLAAALVGLYQLRNVATDRRFPAHHLVRTFLVIGLVGPAIYMIFPVVGPVYAYGAEGGSWAVSHVWPDVLPAIGTPHPVMFDEITPRNCMPSLHTAWATSLFIHTRKGARWMRYAGAFWLVATLSATLGFGYHYGVDLVAGVVFALTIEAAMRAFARGWDLSAVSLVSCGTVVFAGLLTAYRYLPRELAAHPWLFGPVLLLAMVSVIVYYVRTTQSWDPKPTLPRRREPQATEQTEPQPEPA
ncbi:phosphatase PAP2 family protein [Streptomyces sp. cg28]|uniref:phosphatase PAP2 family protein n=1 Tax=Streptomyces sp. cg28 TaxID=3403457 RepID=UPI003B21F37D